MATHRIVTIGLELASSEVQYAAFESRVSLLDWDIILFRPDTSEFFTEDYFKGKRSLSDTTSFRLKDSCEHWRREIRQAFDAGKTVVVFLAPLDEMFVDTGQRTYSGTGRNQRTTRQVEPFTNYNVIPASLLPISATGTSMKLAVKHAQLLGPYWAEFESVSSYAVVLTDPKVPAAVLTRAGDKPVGAVFRNPSGGALLLLPHIDFQRPEFVKVTGGQTAPTAIAKQFGARMIAAVVGMSKALREAGDTTPAPGWASEEKFSLPAETRLRSKLLEAEREVERAQKNKECVADELAAAGAVRALLYEKGKALEHAIINALRLLGFKAESFKDSESEFDVVFESAEGRLIGEAEGKDNKPINVDKLRQLSMNVHEDLQREAVATPAKPVLFGNAYRLQAPAARPEQFTAKCLTAAATSSTALVCTSDLFQVVQYLARVDDGAYATNCRLAILNTVGQVRFPVTPTEPDHPTGAVLTEASDA
jgi:hypothetical protein